MLSEPIQITLKVTAVNEMQRRISIAVGELPTEQAFFSTAEDIILAKLEWYRAGDETSERQWRDILGVLEIQADRLDFTYLQQWAAKLGVKDLLQKALRGIPRKDENF